MPNVEQINVDYCKMKNCHVILSPKHFISHAVCDHSFVILSCYDIKLVYVQYSFIPRYSRYAIHGGGSILAQWWRVNTM